MDGLIRGSIRFPHTVLTATLLLLLFGLISLQRIPLQMRPSVDNPEITVTTIYAGASPQEVEDKITRPIEQELNAVEGLKKLSSTSLQGQSRITLEFDWGVNRDAAMVDVLNKLGRVTNLPEEALSPVAEAISSDTSSPMMWIGFQSSQPKKEDVPKMRALVDDLIEPRIRRIQGVGSLIVSGGQEREIQVVVDLGRLAQRMIPLSQLVATIRRSHLNVRGGPMDVGKREYMVWTSGRSTSTEEMEKMVLQRSGQGMVRLGDVAEVRRSHKRPRTLMHLNGQPALSLGVLRKTGANVPATAQRIQKEVQRLNLEMKQKEIPFRLQILFTEVSYINEALSLVRNNLLLGGFLAVIVLLFFLGSGRAVLVIALAIPISVIVVFLFLDILGRNLNIVSLAGLAFAVGMVVDNAIVVLENIYRYLSQGHEVEESCFHGARQVVLAIGASTVTTVAVFLPIVFLESEAGQIFKDIALAISFAVAFSMIVAATFIPMVSRRLVRPPPPEGSSSTTARLRRLLDSFDQRVTSLYLWFLEHLLGAGKGLRRVTFCLLLVAVFVASLTLLPSAEYLPTGNRNLIITLAKPLPGLNLSHIAQSVAPYEQYLLHRKETARLFTVFNPRFNAVGWILKKKYAAEESSQRLLSQLRRKTSHLAGFRFVFPIRSSIFRTPGKQFEVEISGPELKRLQGLSKIVSRRLRQIRGVISVRSDYEEGAINLQVYPREQSLKEKGLSAYDLAEAVQVALGGLRVGYFLHRGKELDLTLTGADKAYSTPQMLRAMPLVSKGKSFYLGDVAHVREERAPTAIQHLELMRSITLTVNLSRRASLGGSLQEAEKTILRPLRKAIPTDYTLGLGKTADRLNETLRELGSSFLLALLISYLLMVALFRSFFYPLLILVTVPMAATGAFVAIGLTGTSFDTITMLGFIILAGIVVNNAILIVHQTLNLQREGLPFDQALRQGASSRLRPIMMTATTSICGMLPLAAGSGSGTELYRGLGVAIVGGLSLSTLVTLLLVPTLLHLWHDVKTRFRPQPTTNKE